jgi:acrylyl-CoA reductase (NADPH)
MSDKFRAFRIHSEEGRIAARFEDIGLDDLAAGEVVIRVSHSGINYKDALAATGAGRILRRYPLVGGIDLAGTVESSADPRFREGDEVLVTGCALSETHDGGYAERARVRGDWVIPLPAGMNAFDVMAIGTAGFTAALAIHRMEVNGQAPQGGPILVTGASGGVGSIAIDMLKARGYRVIALSGKPAATQYLKDIGADEVLSRQGLDLGAKPLESARFGGAIDNLGGEILTWLTRTTDFWGNIASIGLAAGPDLKTSVMPFILRGVSLIGINSSATPREWRLRVWERIGSDLKPKHLKQIVTRTIDFADLPAAFPPYLEGAVTGRTVVRIG